MRLITIIGTDGSGKTSLSDLLAESLAQEGIAAERVWLGAESQIMRPVRAALRLSWASRRSTGADRGSENRSSGGYTAEISRKHEIVQRYPQLIAGYVAVAWSDYRLQTAAKFWRARHLDVVIADRYLFDVAVNIGLTLDWTPEEVVRFCQHRIAGMPLPQARFFLRVTPEVSLARKDDIPDAGYLRLRLSYYDAIAAAFGFEVLDGTRPLEENLARLRQATFAELGKPYVHYVHANNADVGGADRVLVSMAQHASSPEGSAAPVRVAVSLREATNVLDLHSANGTPVMLHRFVRPQTSAGAIGVIRSAASAPLSFAHFFRLFGREQPDVVHVNDLYDIVPAAAARVRRIPVVYHIRMIKTSDRMRRLFSALIPLISSASVSVSAAVRDHYFDGESVSTSQALVIHDLGNDGLLRNGRSKALVRPAPLSHTGRLVLMVGRVEPWKGQHVFLEAVSLIDPALRDQHTFALVGGEVPGSAEYFAEIANRARDLGVEFLGERSDVPDLLRTADVSVHSSVDPDPFPGVVVESMLAESLTIGSGAGGVIELIPSTAVGRTTAPNDSAALARAIEVAVTMDPEQLRTIGRSARQHVLGLVRPQIVDEQLSSLYHRLVPQSGATLFHLNEKRANR